MQKTPVVYRIAIFVLLAVSSLGLFACTATNNTVTAYDGQLQGRFLPDEELGEFFKNTPAPDLQVVVFHPNCAKGISSQLSFVQSRGHLDYGGYFNLQRTGSAKVSDIRSQTFFGLRAVDYDRYEQARVVAVQYLSSGYPPQSHGSLAANAEAANVDLEECVPGQNDGGIIVWNKRTKIRAAEIAIRSELWAKLFSSLPDA